VRADMLDLLNTLNLALEYAQSGSCSRIWCRLG
jgi:hypothetical protein